VPLEIAIDVSAPSPGGSKRSSTSLSVVTGSNPGEASQPLTEISTVRPGAVIGSVTRPVVEENCFFATGMRLHDAGASHGAWTYKMSIQPATMKKIRENSWTADLDRSHMVAAASLRSSEDGEAVADRRPYCEARAGIGTPLKAAADFSVRFQTNPRKRRIGTFAVKSMKSWRQTVELEEAPMLADRSIATRRRSEPLGDRDRTRRSHILRPNLRLTPSLTSQGRRRCA
jgi:hypothetical protein